MAHVVLTIEPDPKVRRTFLERAVGIFTEVGDLQIDSAESGDLALVWAWGGQAPVGFSENSEACCLLLGYAVDHRDRKLNDKLLLKEWTEQKSDRQAWDGYFASVRYSKTAGLAVDIDPLGFFPMFVSQQHGAFLAGSSGALFEAHPQFQSQLDPVGLAGILLTNGLVNEQTLLKEVRQLRAGCRLFRTSAGFVSEIPTCNLDDSPCDPNRSYQEIQSSLNAGIETAIKRHQPEGCSTTLLLSGGMDSRMVGGYLGRLGIDSTATTFGRPTDFEARAARRVARKLGIPLEIKTAEYPPEELIKAVRRVARLEHLTHGFSGVQEPCLTLENIAPMCWSGYLLDATLGGSAVNFAWDHQTQQLKFSEFFRSLNSWGLPPQALSELLRPVLPDSDAVVAHLIQSLSDAWDQSGRTDTQKAFRMKLATRARYHLAGVVHRLSFISWPINTCCDLELLKSILQVPLETVFQRRLQNDLLQTQFPELAAVPFDTNTFQFDNLPKYAPSSAKNRHVWLRNARISLRRWYWLQWRKIEPRRYHRLFNPDLPDWQLIRRAAEPHRAGLLEWLDEEALTRLVPPPDVNLECDNPFSDGATIRTLCGLMHWKASTLSQLSREA